MDKMADLQMALGFPPGLCLISYHHKAGQDLEDLEDQYGTKSNTNK